MSQKIDHDHRRFREIVRGKIKQNLRKYITQGEMIGKKGKDVVSIPLPQIDIPHFRYGDKQQGGVGQGDGDVGDPLGGRARSSRARARRATGRASTCSRSRSRCEELAEILGEELELPRIEPKGTEKIVAWKDKLHRHPHRRAPSRCATSAARSSRRSRRQIATGTYDPKNPIIVPIREDKRYRSWQDRAVAAVATRSSST